jgi:diguanylate cyclase (GGDEF)-like protein/PAS domain S-box-containing protein
MKRLGGLGSGAAFWIAIAVTLLVAVLAWPAFNPAILGRLEAEAFDLRFRVRGAEAPDPRTVIVVADEKSAQQLGGWPLSRSLWAKAVDHLKQAGAKVIVFDILFPDPEPTMGEDVRRKLSAIAASLPEAAPERHAIASVLQDSGPDARLARSIKEAGNVVLGFALPFGAAAAEIRNSEPPGFLEDWAYGRTRPRPNGDATLRAQAQGAVTPVAAIGEAALSGGYVNTDPDIDGAPRSEWLALQFKDELYPSLAIAAAAAYLGVDTAQLEADIGSGVRIGDRFLPGNDQMQAVANYYGRGQTLPTYSLADLLAGRLPADVFKDKIAVLGADLVALHDDASSPFDRSLPGVERQATMTDRILDGPWLWQPPYVLFANYAAIVVLGLLAAFTAARFPASGGIGIAALLIAAWWFAGYLLLFPGGIRVGFTYPALSVLANFIALTVYRVLREERQRRAAEQSLRLSEERYALAARGANDGLWDWDLTTGHFYTSPRWHQMLGIAAEETSGRPEDLFDRTHRDDIATLRAAIDAHLGGQSAHLEQEFRMRHRDEGDRWIQVRGLAVTDKHGKPYRLAGSMTDITDRKLAERQLLHDAFHSRLTGLPNRALLVDRIGQATQLWQRGGESEVIVLILDLDNFRNINETLGQAVGDEVIISVARNLEAVLRPDDTFAHLGEDEFAVLRFAAGDARAQVEDLIGALKEAMARPIAIREREFELNCSMGYVLASQASGESGDEMLRDANLALYKAKAAGRNRAQQFEAAMHQTALKRFDLEADLRRAIARGGELELFYQPIIDIQNDRMHGYEALIRWRHPTRGLVSPIDFIPLAEDTGLIVEIGRRSILEAARQIAAWTPSSGKPPQVAVNVSGRQFAAEGLLDDIENALKITGIPAECLKIEVTESLIMDNPERTVDILRRIIGLGCKVSIDDFGTGYSSLSHLHRFPFNTLKIDRSFIIRMAESREGFEIVRVIASMAKVLDRDVVAEGVEEQSQIAVLRDLGVEFVQGYVYSKPLPAAEASAFLDKWRQKQRERGVSVAAS